MAMGRPKLEIPRNSDLHLRLSKFEFDKIARVAEKLKISKTDTVVRAINLLETYKPKRYKSFAKNPGQNEPGVVHENSDDD